MYGQELTIQIEKNMGAIKDAVDFMQKTYSKHDQKLALAIIVYLDYDSSEDLFCLRIGFGDKSYIWLEWNLEDIGYVAFDEFPCYNEQDWNRDYELRKKSSNDTKHSHPFHVISGPSRIPISGQSLDFSTGNACI